MKPERQKKKEICRRKNIKVKETRKIEEMQKNKQKSGRRKKKVEETRKVEEI